MYKIIIIIVIIVLTSCGDNFGIIRSIEPKERLDIEVNKNGSALIRSIYCDIYLEELDIKKWKKIFQSPLFTNANSKTNKFRVPRLHFFNIIVHNTSEKPIKIEKISIHYNNTIQEILTIDKLKSLTKSALYSNFNFDNIISTKRLISDKFILNDIDYEKDTLNFACDFIPPSDKIIKIIAFEWIPVQFRKFKIQFSLNVMGIKKIIDFDCKRSEYRKKGKEFTKTTKKDE